MKNLFKTQSAKFVQNPSSFRTVMAKHILVFFITHSVECIDITLSECGISIHAY